MFKWQTRINVQTTSINSSRNTYDRYTRKLLREYDNKDTTTESTLKLTSTDIGFSYQTNLQSTETRRHSTNYAKFGGDRTWPHYDKSIAETH